MTEKLYLKESYLKEIDAKIVSTNGNEFVADKTIFYPGGGGQPFDTGEAVLSGTTYNIVETKKNGEEVVHVANAPISALPGSAIHLSLDWQRRYAFMRYHTAIHLIDGIMLKLHSSQGFSTGGQIFEDRARVDFDMPELNRELAEKIIQEANEFAKEGHKVIVKEMSKEEALSIENIARTEPGRRLIESLNVVRIVEIEGLDMQADGGTHVANTSEIGNISLLRFENKGSHNKRVEIKVAP